MMGKNNKISLADWVAKAEWEGGIIAGFEYGLSTDELDQKKIDPELWQWLIAAEEAWVDLQQAVDQVELRLNEELDDEDED